jgi:hypothetical protein
MKLDFIIVGAHKSGTTWLQKCLETNPSISMPKNPNGLSSERKFEPDYWNDTQVPWANGVKKQQNTDWYESLFDQSKVCGESSPTYLISPEVPEKLKLVVPNVKIIVMLRDPFTRLESYYNFLRANEQSRKRIPDTISKFIRMEHVAQMNLYYKHSLPYINNFSTHFIIYEDIKDSARLIMEKVHAFIGVEDQISIFENQKINSITSRIKEEKRRGNIFQKIKNNFTKPLPYQKLTIEDCAYLTDLYREDYKKIKDILPSHNWYISHFV